MKHFFTCDPFVFLVSRVFKCQLLFLVWPVFASVTNISKGGHFLKGGPIFAKVTQKWPIFAGVSFYKSVTNICECVPFLQVWPIFEVWHIFLRVTQFSKSDLFFKCDPFFEVWPIFFQLSVTHFSKCDPFFQVWPICSQIGLFFWPIMLCYPFFQGWPDFSKCDPCFCVCVCVCSIFQVWPIFLRATHFWPCGRVWIVFPSDDPFL